MNAIRWRVGDIAARQHGVVAVWQLKRLGMSPEQIKAGLRGLRRVHRGVAAVGDLTELGWLMAAALTMGPGAAISHLTGVQLWRLRPWEAGDVHVSIARHTGLAERDGVVLHRRRRFATLRLHGIPVTSPTRCLADAALERHELYRALEEADRLDLRIDRSRLSREVVDLQRRARGRTRSDAEARFLFICGDHEIPLPLVNHRVNGIEADFHWPAERFVVEVDGWEFHKERDQFEEDRRRGIVHAAAGHDVIRVSAAHVRSAPRDVAAAVLARAAR